MTRASEVSIISLADVTSEATLTSFMVWGQSLSNSIIIVIDYFRTLSLSHPSLPHSLRKAMMTEAIIISLAPVTSEAALTSSVASG